MSNLEKVMNVIIGRISKGEISHQLFTDGVSVILGLEKENHEIAMSKAREMFHALDNIDATELKDMSLVVSAKKEILKYESPFVFDSYLRYIEWDREPSKRFYQPRRERLVVVAQDLQDLADDKLDLLAISMPPGVGKTGIGIFFLCWLAGRDPDKGILGASHSASFMRGVYDECLRIIEKGGDYLWSEVFPHVQLQKTDAKNMMIDMGTPKRFTTLQFTSIGAGNAGKVRAEQLLYCDDLIDGIETAMNVERMEKLYVQYQTDLTQRKIGNCKELHIATRWSVHDPIGKLEVINEGNPRARFRRIPALNENDESNFDYKNTAGFTTEFFHKQRDNLDNVSWNALYMNEPIEREGLLYDAESLNRYYDLPTEEPDAVYAVVDTKDSGDDYCFMPVAYQYGTRFYIEDCVCDNGLLELITPKVVSKLMKHKVKICQFESNNAGGVIADVVKEILKDKGAVTHINKKFTTRNKETKILVNSPYVKENFYFKDKSTYTVTSEYGVMMKFLTSYTLKGRNKHDDVPDGMAMLAEFVQNDYASVAKVVKKPF